MFPNHRTVAKAGARLSASGSRQRWQRRERRSSRHRPRSTGMSEKAARQVIVRQCEGVLRPDVELPFDNPELADNTVGDVLADPERFEGETLVDPLEGRVSCSGTLFPTGAPRAFMRSRSGT